MVGTNTITKINNLLDIVAHAKHESMDMLVFYFCFLSGVDIIKKKVISFYLAEYSFKILRENDNKTKSYKFSVGWGTFEIWVSPVHCRA